MPKFEQKQVIIDEIKAKLDKAVSVVLVDARGTTVEEDTILRKKMRDAGVEYKVYKNTMIERAIEGTQFADLKDYLSGPTTVAFSYEGATDAAAILANEAKTVKALEFKASIIEGVVYDAKGTEAIANIPSKEVLLSKLLGSFKSPMSTFARVIKQVAEQKAGEAA